MTAPRSSPNIAHKATDKHTRHKDYVNLRALANLTHLFIRPSIRME